MIQACKRIAATTGPTSAAISLQGNTTTETIIGERAISEDLRSRMLGWRCSGICVHNRVRVAAEDAEGRKKRAGYMLRAPLSLAKMSYDAPSGTVIQGGEGAQPFPGGAAHPQGI